MKRAIKALRDLLDEILDAFIFQRTKFMFLYLISRMYPESFGTPAPRRRKIQSQHLPDCFSPIMEPKYSSQTNTPILKQESPHTSTPSTPSSGINLSRNLQTKLGYWNDTIRLLVDFNWKVDEDIDVIAQVGNQIRLDLRRTVKNHLRRQQQSNTKVKDKFLVFFTLAQNPLFFRGELSMYIILFIKKKSLCFWKVEQILVKSNS
ncbi:hypothetical protein BY996DRAFT_3990445 [Phakopsora pachyrhizi]|nr:hypothetical protein BY996DRAFT_3990445 [Phakopsora pachyrhizi]